VNLYTSIAANNLTMNSAKILWNSDEPADSQVEYGLTTNYGVSTPLDLTMATAHAITLSNLTANTLYHYRVKSKDAAGNLATSNDFTFTTARDTQAPAISNITVTAITANSAQIKWTADEPSNGRVEYGPDSTTLANAVLDTNFAITHTVSLANLQANTKYYFRIIASDRAGNSRTGAKQSFTTLRTVVNETQLAAGPTTPALRNYPNPFRDFTRFEIALPNAGLASLKIYDLQGREVATLLEGLRPAGQHSVVWRIQSGANAPLTSGVYFAVLRYQSEVKSLAPLGEIKQKVFYVK